MSTIIDDKIVAGAKICNTVKEDPILLLSVSNLYYFVRFLNLIQFTDLNYTFTIGKGKITVFFSRPLF